MHPNNLIIKYGGNDGVEAPHPWWFSLIPSIGNQAHVTCGIGTEIVCTDVLRLAVAFLVLASDRDPIVDSILQLAATPKSAVTCTVIEPEKSLLCCKRSKIYPNG